MNDTTTAAARTGGAYHRTGPTLLDRIDAAYAAPLPMAQGAVLVALVRHTDDAGACWPSVDRLAAMVGASERTVRRALDALVDAGYLTRERDRRPWDGRYAGYRYRVDLDRLGCGAEAPSAPDTVTAGPPDTVTAGPPDTVTGHEGVSSMKAPTPEERPPYPPSGPRPSGVDARGGGEVRRSRSRSRPPDVEVVALADAIGPDVDPHRPATADALDRLAPVADRPTLAAAVRAALDHDRPEVVHDPAALAEHRLRRLAADPSTLLDSVPLHVRYAAAAEAMRGGGAGWSDVEVDDRGRCYAVPAAEVGR